jgi:cob(I)alamin adenosyltransferase
MVNKDSQRGLVIVYFGLGKGKTTAALGAGLRAVGRGMNVKVLQFIKGEPAKSRKKGAVVWASGERLFADKISKSMSNVKRQISNIGRLEIEAVGTGFVGIMGDKLAFREHKAAAQKALRYADKVVKDKDWQVVVLDEILRAIGERLITITDVLKIIKAKSPKQHLILTGHRAPKSILAIADLATEMKKVKHPYDRGILAKIGIDF